MTVTKKKITFAHHETFKSLYKSCPSSVSDSDRPPTLRYFAVKADAVEKEQKVSLSSIQAGQLRSTLANTESTGPRG